MTGAAELLERANRLLDSGQLVQARQMFSRICEMDQGNAEAWLMLGVIDSETGRVEDALKYVQHAIELDAAYEEAHLTLAEIQRQQGRLEDALTSCSRALQIAPDYEEAWVLQSGIQGALQRYVDAQESSRRALELWPQCVDAHINLGNACKAQGEWQQAIDSYQAALQLEPDRVPVYASLGLALLEQDRLDEASNCFSHVLRKDPGNTEAALGMARVCMSLSDPEGAIEYCHRALEPASDNVAVSFILCEALISADRLQEAERVCAAISVQQAQEISVALMHWRILERKGDYQQGYDLLNSLKDRYADDSAFLAAFAESSRHVKRIGEAKQLLEQRLRRKELHVNSRKTLLFSLGHLYDANSQYDLAFEQFKEANRLKPAVFDTAGHAAAIQRLIDVYTPELLGRLPRATTRSKLPVFIIGMPRSGTTLIEQILSSHPEVVGAGELPYIGQMTVTLAAETRSQVPYPECVQFLTQDDLDRLGRSYLMRLKQKAGTAVRLTDKQNGNYLHLGLIQLLFPEARVIRCTRDPMDICLSLYTHDMGGEATYTRTFESLAFYYRQYEHLMVHWLEVLDIQVMNLRYEALVRDQRGKTRELLEFCELPWDDRCLDFHHNRRTVATPSHAQVRQPLYEES
ncbi:MAG: sulfotransferase, partial [Gammaproteobacteria bacterium]